MATKKNRTYFLKCYCSTSKHDKRLFRLWSQGNENEITGKISGKKQIPVRAKSTQENLEAGNYLGKYRNEREIHWT